MDTKTRTTLCIISAFLTVTLSLAAELRAEARVLETDFTVNDSESYTWDEDCDWEIDELSESGSKDVDCTVTATVTEDNQDGTFDISLSQSSGTITIDNGTPGAMSTGSTAEIATEGRGRVTSLPDYEDLFPDLDEDWNYGSMSDSTGPFITTAVDEEDEWSQTFSVTPYGESARDVTVTCVLEEWTTLLGYNVAKIQRTWIHPISAVDNQDSNKTLTGNVYVTEYMYYSYDDKVLVKVDRTLAGTLTLTTGECAPDDEYDVDWTVTVVMTID